MVKQVPEWFSSRSLVAGDGNTLAELRVRRRARHDPRRIHRALERERLALGDERAVDSPRRDRPDLRGRRCLALAIAGARAAAAHCARRSPWIGEVSSAVATARRILDRLRAELHAHAAARDVQHMDRRFLPDERRRRQSSEMAAFLSTPFDACGAVGIVHLGWGFGRIGRRARQPLYSSRCCIVGLAVDRGAPRLRRAERRVRDRVGRACIGFFWRTARIASSPGCSRSRSRKAARRDGRGNS